MRIAGLLAVLTIVSGPLAAQRTMPPRLEAKLAEVGLSTALEEQGLPGIREYLLGDGVLGWPMNGWVVGPANASAVLTAQPVADSTRIALEMLRTAVSEDSTTVLIEGVAALRRDGVRPVRLGRYLAAWQRIEGEWRLRLFLPVGLIDVRESRSTTLPIPIAPPVTSRAVQAADSAFWALARASGMTAAYAAVVDSAAVWAFTGTGELAIGLEAVTTAIRPLVRQTWIGRTQGAASSPDGSLGWAVGELVVTNPTTGSISAFAAYATFWQRGRDGRLRLRAIASVPRQ